MDDRTEPPDWVYDHCVDGGDRQCGELLIELRSFFAPLAPGARVCVITQDFGAWIDLPAWCRVVGHRFLARAHPYYLIEKGEP